MTKISLTFVLLLLTGCVHFQRTLPKEVSVDQAHSIQDSIDRDIQRENQRRK